MKMDDMATLAPQMAAQASPEIFKELGHITRQLHDTLSALGVMPKLQEAADGLPDARSRLSYIAKKTGEAADKVLNSVDQAKLEHSQISERTREMAAALVADPVKAVASGAVINFVGAVEDATARTGSAINAAPSLRVSAAMRWCSCLAWSTESSTFSAAAAVLLAM